LKGFYVILGYRLRNKRPAKHDQGARQNGKGGKVLHGEEAMEKAHYNSGRTLSPACCFSLQI